MASSPASDKASLLVGEATSLLVSLDTDTLELVTSKVRAALLHGKRWSRKIDNEHIRDDQRLEVSTNTRVIWLREDFQAQLSQVSSWKSYDGKTKTSPEYGGGGSSEHIGPRDIAYYDGREEHPKHSGAGRPKDDFLSDPSIQSMGTWELITEADGIEILRISGDGHYSAGAVEDDDLLYHGSGPKRITIEVSVAELRKDWSQQSIDPTSEAEAPPNEKKVESLLEKPGVCEGRCAARARPDPHLQPLTNQRQLGAMQQLLKPLVQHACDFLRSRWNRHHVRDTQAGGYPERPGSAASSSRRTHAAAARP